MMLTPSELHDHIEEELRFVEPWLTSAQLGELIPEAGKGIRGALETLARNHRIKAHGTGPDRVYAPLGTKPPTVQAKEQAKKSVGRFFQKKPDQDRAKEIEKQVAELWPLGPALGGNPEDYVHATVSQAENAIKVAKQVMDSLDAEAAASNEIDESSRKQTRSMGAADLVSAEVKGEPVADGSDSAGYFGTESPHALVSSGFISAEDALAKIKSDAHNKELEEMAKSAVAAGAIRSKPKTKMERLVDVLATYKVPISIGAIAKTAGLGLKDATKAASTLVGQGKIRRVDKGVYELATVSSVSDAELDLLESGASLTDEDAAGLVSSVELGELIDEPVSGRSELDQIVKDSVLLKATPEEFGKEEHAKALDELAVRHKVAMDSIKNFLDNDKPAPWQGAEAKVSVKEPFGNTITLTPKELEQLELAAYTSGQREAIASYAKLESAKSELTSSIDEHALKQAETGLTLPELLKVLRYYIDQTVLAFAKIEKP